MASISAVLLISIGILSGGGAGDVGDAQAGFDFPQSCHDQIFPANPSFCRDAPVCIEDLEDLYVEHCPSIFSFISCYIMRDWILRLKREMKENCSTQSSGAGPGDGSSNY